MKAVASAHKNPRLTEARRDSDLIRKAAIHFASWDDSTLVLSLDNELSLVFSLCSGRVVWKVEPNATPSKSSPDEPLILQFSSERPPFTWNRCQLIRDRLLHSVQMIFPGGDWVYFYTEGTPILLLQRIVECDTGRERLFWCDSE